MALPKPRTPEPQEKINTFTGEPHNENIKENDIVEYKEFLRYKIYNSSGDSVECFRVRGLDNEDYLVSLAYQNTLGYCNAIQYQKVKHPSLFLGEILIDRQKGPTDYGYAWVPVVKEFLNV